MERLLRDMPLFVEVARQKSFSRAADALDMPVSTLSRRIAGLERELGLPLFRRNSRNVELTESGKEFFLRCEFIVGEAEMAKDMVTRNMKSPSGRVRVSMTGDLYHTFMRGMLSAFAAKWPGIHLQVHFTERNVDLLTEPFDLDLRGGPLPDSGLKARKLITLRPALYASPSLLEFHPAPEKPEDLRNIPCITLAQAGNTWTMRKGERVETVPVNAVHTVNTISIAYEFALEGLGVSWMAPSLIPVLEEHGDLVPILPGWTSPGVDINVLMADRELPRRVRLFVDYLVNYFAGLPESYTMAEYKPGKRGKKEADSETVQL